jgi:alpha-ketoglutaric semialdehyde dehydrogenase
MRINQEEIFGPVASVIRVRNYDEALQVANDVPVGLSSGIVTGSVRRRAW